MTMRIKFNLGVSVWPLPARAPEAPAFDDLVWVTRISTFKESEYGRPIARFPRFQEKTTYVTTSDGEVIKLSGVLPAVESQSIQFVDTLK